MCAPAGPPPCGCPCERQHRLPPCAQPVACMGAQRSWGGRCSGLPDGAACARPAGLLGEAEGRGAGGDEGGHHAAGCARGKWRPVTGVHACLVHTLCVPGPCLHGQAPPPPPRSNQAQTPVNACMLRKGLRACTSALLGRPGSTKPPGRAQPAQHARCSAACRPAARAGTHLGAMPRQRQASATRPSPMLAPRSKRASGGAPASQGGGGCGAVRLTRAVWGAQA